MSEVPDRKLLLSPDPVGMMEEGGDSGEETWIKRGARPLLKGLMMIASLALVGFVFRSFDVSDLFGTQWLDQEIIGHGIRGELLFIALGGVATAIGFPRQVVAFGAGYAFGLWGGVAIGLVAQISGCVITFFYARSLGHRMVRSRFGARIQRFDAFLSGHTFSMTILFRLLPFGSNPVINLLAGVSGAQAVAFFCGSAVGYIPQTLVFALLGTGITVNPVFRIGLSVALFVVSGIFGVMLFRRLSRSRKENPFGKDRVTGDPE